MAEHAARLGAVLQTMEKASARELTRERFERGIELAEWYASEWLRLHEAQNVKEQLLAAEKLRRWLSDEWQGDVIGLPEVYQRGPNSLRDAATARACMRTLAEHGWAIPLTDGAEVEGKRRHEAWQIVRGDETVPKAPPG
jgi:hypothetical protein